MLSQHNQKIIIQKFALNVACPQRRATLRANIFVIQITWICSATAIFALNVARLWGQATLRANIFHVQNTCPQSRLPSKSSALKVVCPQSRLPSMSPALNVAGSTSRAQRRLPSMSHSRPIWWHLTPLWEVLSTFFSVNISSVAQLSPVYCCLV